MGLPEDAGGGGASSLDLVLAAEIVVALDGDRLIAIRRPRGARPPARRAEPELRLQPAGRLAARCSACPGSGPGADRLYK